MKNCPSCGNELADNAVMCVKCGNKINGVASSGSTVSDFGFMNKVKIGIILIVACKVLSWLFGIIKAWLFGFFEGVFLSIDADILTVTSTVSAVMNYLFNAGIIVGIILVLLAVIQFEKELLKK